MPAGDGHSSAEELAAVAALKPGGGREQQQLARLAPLLTAQALSSQCLGNTGVAGIPG